MQTQDAHSRRTLKTCTQDVHSRRAYRHAFNTYTQNVLSNVPSKCTLKMCPQDAHSRCALNLCNTDVHSRCALKKYTQNVLSNVPSRCTLKMCTQDVPSRCTFKVCNTDVHSRCALKKYTQAVPSRRLLKPPAHESTASLDISARIFSPFLSKGPALACHSRLCCIYNNYTLKPFKELGLNSQRVKKLASKLLVQSVNFAAKLVHTRRALSSTVIDSHQEPVSGQACNPLDPH